LGTNLYFSFVYYRILTFSNGNKKNYELEKMSVKKNLIEILLFVNKITKKKGKSENKYLLLFHNRLLPLSYRVFRPE